MPLIRPTAQNIALLLVVHQTIAAVVARYPNKLSMGTKTPTSEVSTSGSKQYPSTEAERLKVNVELKCVDPDR